MDNWPLGSWHVSLPYRKSDVHDMPIIRFLMHCNIGLFFGNLLAHISLHLACVITCMVWLANLHHMTTCMHLLAMQPLEGPITSPQWLNLHHRMIMCGTTYLQSAWPAQIPHLKQLWAIKSLFNMDSKKMVITENQPNSNHLQKSEQYTSRSQNSLSSLE